MGQYITMFHFAYQSELEFTKHKETEALSHTTQRKSQSAKLSEIGG
jgi:hypothetical protein